MEDPRFRHVATDPRFRRFRDLKVKVGSRFKKELRELDLPSFRDKRGRPVNSSTKEDLHHLYDYEDSSDEEAINTAGKRHRESSKKKKKVTSEDCEEMIGDDEGAEEEDASGDEEEEVSEDEEQSEDDSAHSSDPDSSDEEEAINTAGKRHRESSKKKKKETSKDCEEMIGDDEGAEEEDASGGEEEEVSEDEEQSEDDSGHSSDPDSSDEEAAMNNTAGKRRRESSKKKKEMSRDGEEMIGDDEGAEEEDASGDEEGEASEDEEQSEDDSVHSSDPDFSDGAPGGARGEGLDTSDEEEEEEVEEEETDLDHDWNEPDHSAPIVQESSHRLALLHADWDKICAKDIFILVNSFIPSGGALQSVTVYPTQFGLERMAEEEQQGPWEFQERGENKKSKKRGELGSKRRTYQLQRLKYFVAVIVLDSKETAEILYKELDGMEYGNSSCRLDLRFIPEGTTFEESPKDICTGVTDVSAYQPPVFSCTALGHTKVRVTWDETSMERLRRTVKKFTEEDLLDTAQWEDLIGSSEDSSGEDEGEKNERRKIYKKLMKEVKTEEKAEEEEEPFALFKKESKNEEERTSSSEASSSEGAMEYSWRPSASLEMTKKLSPFGEYLEKRKSKKKAKRQRHTLKKLKEEGIQDTVDLGFEDSFFKDDPKKKKKRAKKKKRQEEAEESEAAKQERLGLELLVKDDGEQRHFNLTQIMREESEGRTKRGKKRKQTQEPDIVGDSFTMTVDPSRFPGLFTDPNLAIDPNSSDFKRTKGMEALMEDVVKKKRKM